MDGALKDQTINRVKERSRFSNCVFSLSQIFSGLLRLDLGVVGNFV